MAKAKRKDDSYKSITKSNLKALRKIETSTQFMLLYAILEELEKRIIQLEKKTNRIDKLLKKGGRKKCQENGSIKL